MDLLNMTNMAQFHEFYKKVKYRKFIFQDTDLKCGIYLFISGMEVILQNFSTISLKLCLLAPKNRGTCRANTTIVSYLRGSFHGPHNFPTRPHKPWYHSLCVTVMLDYG